MSATVSSAGIAAFVERHRDAAVDLLLRMIEIDSVTGNEGRFGAFCADWLEARGVNVIRQPVKGRINVIGTVGRGTDALVVSGHLDTVPANVGAWRYGPWTATVADDRVYGLGASDLKVSIAGAYVASLFLKDCPLPGRVVTAFTIEEETTGDGTKEFLRFARESGLIDPARAAAVVTEPTGLQHVALGSRGALWLVAKVKGLGGHGSRPHLARNPIDAVRRALDAVERLAEEWRSDHADADFPAASVTPTSINAGDGTRTNVIPEQAEFVLDCRPTPSLAALGFDFIRTELESRVTRAIGDGFDVAFEMKYPRPGHKLDRAHPLAVLTLDVLRTDLGLANADFQYTPAGNDACYFGELGIPTINKVGPGLPECAHRVDEFVPVANVALGVEFFIRLALRHFGVPIA